MSGPAPSSDWRRSLTVIWIVTFASMVGGHLAMPFLPLYIHTELGVDDIGDAAIWAGLATAGTGVMMAATAPLWGVLADRHGRKAMLVRAQFAIGLSNAVSGLVVTPSQIVVVRSVQGAFSGVVSAARALVAGSVPRERIPQAIGLIQSSIYVGQTLGPVIGGLIASAVGFRAAFFATGCINLVAGTAAALYIRENRSDSASSRRATSRAGISALLRSRPLALLVAMLFLSSAAQACTRPIIPLFLSQLDSAGNAATIAGLGFSILGISGAVASIVSSRGAWGLSLRRTSIVAALGGAAVTLLISLATTPWLVLALLFGVGIFQGLLASATTTLVSLHAPSSLQGTAFGVTASGQALALATGPLTGGLIAAAYGLNFAFVAAALMLLASGAFGVIVPPPPRPREKEDS
jgi:DHA1 family multidrug resistance protein-like MFS transporter